MKKALFVMDMQEVCVGANHAAFFQYDSSLMEKVNSVISSTDAVMVVYIKNLMKKNLISKLSPIKVYDGSPEAELAEDLLKVSTYVFSKYKRDAFSNADLCTFLKDNSIDTVELTGIDGGGCVSLTALGAIGNGYKVIMQTAAIGTMFTAKRDRYYAELKKRGAVFNF